MPLLLGQLVHTSFPIVGFRTLASAQVPAEIQQAFIQQVVCQYWDSYSPPKFGYRAVYLHQVTSEHTLFGWLYNDGGDDLGRSHVPYFICYYLTEQLQPTQLDNIFTCLQRGPVAMIDRRSLPSALETVAGPDLWSYQPARLGVAIPTDVRECSHTALNQRRLPSLFIPFDEREIVAKLNEQIYKQQRTAHSVNTHLVIKGVETGVANIEDAAVLKSEALESYQGYQEGLQSYEQVLIDAAEGEYPLSTHTRVSPMQQQALGLKAEHTTAIEEETTQRIEAVQSPDQVAGSRAQSISCVVFSTSRSLLIWGLVLSTTTVAVVLSLVFLKPQQVPTSGLSDLQPSSSAILMPLKSVNEPTKLERPLQLQLGEETLKANEKHSSGVQVSQSTPGFPTGTYESTVAGALGKPTQTSTGYWPNTYTALYDLVPDQITVGYIFDHDSERVRQTEVSFAQSVNPLVVQATLNQMLDGSVAMEIQQGLQQVRQRQSNQYSFATGRLEGVIERNERDRIYIGVWDADLH